MQNFWTTLKKPIFIQAPMEDVTDTVFRQIIIRCGKPDVFFTEFTNVEGFCSIGREKVGKRLIFTPIEHPIVAQIWGNNPKNYFETARLIKTMGFDGIDINMGCPEKQIVKKGSCSALINNPNLTKEIILATREGAGGLPVSVKTRIGFRNIQTEEWIGFLLNLKLDALIIHGRTAMEMSDVPAHWDEIEKVVKLRNSLKKQTLIIGNGDVKDLNDAMGKYEKYKVDGIMIGRGIFNNLWLFNKSSTFLTTNSNGNQQSLKKVLDKNVDHAKISYQEKLKILIQHITLFDKTWDKTKNFSIMKKFYKIYISGAPNASELRATLMKFTNARETINFLKQILHH